MKVKQTAGTSKLIAIILRRMEARLETRGCRWGRFLLVEVARLFVRVAAGERMLKVGV
jgi:hypothetical protein